MGLRVPTQLLHLYTQEDIVGTTGIVFFNRGEEYFRAGHVQEIQFSSDRLQLAGRVHGTQDTPYHVNIQFTDRIVGTCTCPVHRNCKHVAAVLLQGLTNSPALSTPPTNNRPAKTDTAPSTTDRTYPACTQKRDKPSALMRKTRPIVPRAHLTLTTVTLTVRPQYRAQAGAATLTLPVVQLTFAYENETVSWADNRPCLIRIEQDCLIETPLCRDTTVSALTILHELGFAPLQKDAALIIPPGHAHDLVLHDRLHEQEARLIELSLTHVPKLRAMGWTVVFAADYPYRPVDSVDSWYGNLEESRTDWFGLELGLVIEGERVNLLPILLGILQQTQKNGELAALRNYPATHRINARLEDGRLISLPAPRVAHILGILVDLYEGELTPHGTLPLHSSAISIVTDLQNDEAPICWQGGLKLQAMAHAFRTLCDLPSAPQPINLKATLRPYQQIGVNWLQCLRAHGFNGVLADDMGLGKTIQTLTHLLLEKEAGRMDRPTLIVAPTTLIDNWRRETARFTPTLRMAVLHGNTRKQYKKQLPECDIILTTYPLLTHDMQTLLTREYHYLVLDEAQFIKNPKSKAAQLVRHIKTRHRLALTGTPFENHLGELWALMDFLMPHLLGNQRRFTHLFRIPIEKHQDHARRDALFRRIRPFLLRRTKEAVAADLPPKTEIICTVSLAGDQRDLYEALRVAMHSKIRDAIDRQGLTRSRLLILDALLKLRQVCCDPRLVKLPVAQSVQHSAKLTLLRELIPSLIEDGRRILLFSQFTSMLTLIQLELDTLHLPYVTLTGKTVDRVTPVQSFQEGHVPIFLISLKAGGTGLNLTTADTVIHYDPWWNPAVERQATDRAHRIGQDKPVFVYKLITEGTVEDKIATLQKRKQALTDSLLQGEANEEEKITDEDYEELFAP